MYSTDRSKSSSTPAVATPVASVGTTPGVGNAARQDDLGLGSTVPATTAGSSTEALRAMGSMGAVVLDAMPVGAALRAAWTLRDMDWARAWMLAQETGDVLAEGADVLADALDTAWPVGVGVGIGAFGQGTLGEQLATESSGTIERMADALRVEISASAAAMVQAGFGGAILDARGDAWIGATADVTGGASAQVNAAWTLPTVFSFLPATVSAEVFRMLVAGAPQGVLALVQKAVEDHIRSALPDEWRVEGKGEGVGAESLGAGVGGGQAETGGDGCLATGVDGHGQYLEVSFERMASGAAWIYEALSTGGAPEAAFKEANGYMFRLETTADALAAEQLEGGRLVVTSPDGDGLVTHSLGVLVSWLCSRVMDAPEGLRKVEVADVTLRRGIDRKLGPESAAPMPEVVEYADHILPDHGFPILGYTEVSLSAEVVVGPDAVRAAVGDTLIAEDQTAEEATLDVERAIAADLIGGASCEGMVVYDSEAGMAAARLDHADRTTSVAFAAGGGTSLSAGIGEGLAAGGNVQIFYRESLEAEEARAELMAAK